MYNFNHIQAVNHAEAIELYRQLGLNVEMPNLVLRVKNLKSLSEDLIDYLRSLNIGVLNYHHVFTVEFYFDFIVIQVFNRPNEEASLYLFITRME
jgi:hypothetical protein